LTAGGPREATSTSPQPGAGAPGETAPTANPSVTATAGSAATVSAVTGTLPPPAPTTVQPAPTAPPGPGPHTVTVTDADSGKSYTLTRGDTLVVQLSGSPGYPWTEPTSSSDSVLHRTGGSTTTAGNASATFSADAPGKADVSATESATCSTATPRCMIATRAFNVSVTVRR